MIGPFQRRIMDRSGRTARMSDLMRDDAAIQANAEMQAANASAHMVQGIGNAVSDVAGAWARTEQERPRRELEEARLADVKRDTDTRRQITEVLKLTRNPETGELDLRQAAKEISALDPLRAQEFFQAASEQDKSTLLANKQRLEQLGQLAGATLLNIDRLPPPQRPAAILDVAQQAVSRGLLRPEDIPEQPTEAWLRQAFTSVLSTADLADQLAAQSQPQGEIIETVGPDGQPVKRRVGEEELATGVPVYQKPDKPKEQMVTVTGPDGQPITRLATEEELRAGVRTYREPRQAPAATYQWAQLGDGPPKLMTPDEIRSSGATSIQQNRVPTEGERKAASFATQMEQAVKTIDELESQLTEKDLYQIQSLPQEGIVAAINRGEMSEAAKRYLQAFEQFTEARLRPVSGAAIADSEYARDRRTYARQYGETPKLAEQRMQSRQAALTGLKTMAGRADTTPSTASISVTAPNGKTYTFADKKSADEFKRKAGIP